MTNLGDPTARPPICGCGNKMASASRVCAECAQGRKQGQRYNWRDLTGKVFDRLTVVEPTSEYSSRGCVWLCRCSCGEMVRNVAAKLNQYAKDLASGKRKAPIACPACVVAAGYKQAARRARG